MALRKTESQRIRCYHSLTSNLYLRKIEATHMPPPACMTGQTEKVLGNKTFEKRLVTIFSYHDESSFHANEGQSWQWAEENMLALRSKS